MAIVCDGWRASARCAPLPPCDVPDNGVVVRASGLAQRRLPLAHLALPSRGCWHAFYCFVLTLSRPSVAIADTPPGNRGCAASVRAWLVPQSRLDPRMFLPVRWRIPDRNDGSLRPHSRRPEWQPIVV